MSAFGDNQRSYYLSEINRAIPASSVATTPTITTALGTIDPLLPSFRTNFDPKQFTSTFATGSDVVLKDQACRSNVAPSIGMRDQSSRTGCGWWYIDNPNLQSVGAYGTRRGPMKPTLDTQYGPGEWIWDIKEAIQREGLKAANKVTSCQAIQHSPYTNMGWCPSTNRAVVTDGNGNAAFPNTPQGNCPGPIITRGAQCDPLYVCQGLGRSSSGGEGGIRLYSQAECNQLGGNWHGNGECTKRTGGSWSWDCRGLNTGSVTSGGGAADLCTDGNLSPGCLKTIVQAQCNSTGTLAQALSSGYASTDQVANDMNSVMLERNLTLPAGILNDGKMTQSDAVKAVSQLRGWGNDSNVRTAGAANNLCYGTPFDMCGFTTNTPKPFSVACIRRMAQAAGWSPNGTAMPTNDNMSAWNSLNTWGDVLGQIASWKQLADNPGPNQLEYIKKVYGIGAAYPNRCPSITLGEHCGPNQGWQKTMPGAGTFYADSDFPSDASYIVVPKGATAELTNRNGDVHRVVGPSEYNFCSMGHMFNDKTKKIVVYPSDFPPATPYDNGRTYGGGDRIVYKMMTYKLANFIGAAGYSPEHPSAGSQWKVDPETTPAKIPLATLQRMFNESGCTRRLEEGHVGWWRQRAFTQDIKNDMNAYGSLTSNCSGSKGQHDFCSPGKCP